jgi:hypothetical protein
VLSFGEGLCVEEVIACGVGLVEHPSADAEVEVGLCGPADVVEAPRELEGELGEVCGGVDIAELKGGAEHGIEPEESGGALGGAEFFESFAHEAEGFLFFAEAALFFGGFKESASGFVAGVGLFKVSDDGFDQEAVLVLELHPLGDTAVHLLSDGEGDLLDHHLAEEFLVEAEFGFAGEGGLKLFLDEFFVDEFEEDVRAVVELGDGDAFLESPRAFGEVHAFEAFDGSLPKDIADHGGFSEGILGDAAESLEMFEQDAFDGLGDAEVVGEGFALVELALNALEEGEQDAGVSFAFEEELFLLAGREGRVLRGVAQECAAFFGGKGRDFERGGWASEGEGKAVEFARCSGDQDKEPWRWFVQESIEKALAARVKEEEVIKEEGNGCALCAEVDIPTHGVFDLSIAGGFGVPEFKEKGGPCLPVGVALCVSGDGLVEGLGAIEAEVVEVALEEALEVGGGAAFLGAIFGAPPKEEGGLLEVTPLLEDAAASTAGLSDERDDLDIAVLGVDPCLFERAEDIEASEEREFGVAFFVGGLGGGLGFPCELVGRFF